MVVYIDVLIFTNIIINYLILSLTQKILHIKTKEFRIILSAVVGALFSLTVFVPYLSNFLSLLIKLICAMLICLIAFKTESIRLYVKSVFVTYSVTIIFCGFMILLNTFIKSDRFAILNDTVYFQIDPLILILLSVITYLAVIIIQRFLKSDLENTVVSLKMTINSNDYSCIAKIDTACTVSEPFTGAPVIIAESVLFDKPITTNRIIPYKALGAEGVLNGIKADKISIDNKVIQKDVYIGIFNGIIDPQFKAIINYKIVR